MALLASLCVPTSAAPQAIPVAGQGPEPIDARAIAAIRDEGLKRSRVMDYGEGLSDLVGSRLTGSADFERAVQWCLAQLRDMGVGDAREEGWGEFGMAWRQLGASAALVEPAPAVFPAQATPWSPSTAGEVTAPVVLVPQLRAVGDFARWRGRLAGKIILYGEPPPVDPNPRPSLVLLDETKLKALQQPPPPSHQEKDNRDFFVAETFDEVVARFFSPTSMPRPCCGRVGDGGALHDDTAFSMGSFVYLPSHRQPIASAVVSSEAYGRMARLIARGVPVTLRLVISTQFGAEHAPGVNLIADIPGADPSLRSQVVMLGGHLDSWAAGTGATDDGAGVIIALEAMRILKATGLKPRRTVRLALWGGEEEGELGSLGYVQAHLADIRYGKGPESAGAPLWLQTPQSVTLHPEARTFEVYFNMDRGPGRFLGVNAEGNGAAADIFRRWAAPLADLGLTTVTLRHTGPGGQRQLPAGRPARVQLHPVGARRQPHPPHRPRHLRTAAGSGPEAGRHGAGGLRLRRRPARRSLPPRRAAAQPEEMRP